MKKYQIQLITLSLLSIISTQSYSALIHRPMRHTPYYHNHSEYKKHIFSMIQPKDCLAPVCAESQQSHILDHITQNEGRALPNPCHHQWFDRISLSGGLNLDIGKWGSRNANIMGENYQRLSLNDLYLNIKAEVNNWVYAFTSISYSNPTTNINPAVYNSFGLAEYNAGYANNININSPILDVATANNRLQLEQVFATIGDLTVQPFFFQFGKQFQDFSRYQIHPISLTLTQVISEILTTSAKFGFVMDGFNGSISIFNDPIYKTGTTNNPTNYAISAGYHNLLTCNHFGYSLGGAFLFNMIGANNIAYNVQSFSSGGYHKHASAMAFYADLLADNLSFNARYTAAIQRFAVTDLPKNGIADLAVGVPIPIGALGVPIEAATGAKPWAFTIQGNYGFNCLGPLHVPQTIYAGYQTSRESAGLNLPRHRYLVGYNIYPLPKSSFWLEWDRDYGYKKGNGGTDRNTNLVTIRFETSFS